MAHADELRQFIRAEVAQGLAQASGPPAVHMHFAPQATAPSPVAPPSAREGLLGGSDDQSGVGGIDDPSGQGGPGPRIPVDRIFSALSPAHRAKVMAFLLASGETQENLFIHLLATETARQLEPLIDELLTEPEAETGADGGS